MTIDLFADLPQQTPQIDGLKLPLLAGYSVQSIEFNGAVGYKITVPQGEFLYFPQFFSPKVADRALNFLLENSLGHTPAQFDDAIAWTNIPWRLDTINMYGKQTSAYRASLHGMATMTAPIPIQALPFSLYRGMQDLIIYAINYCYSAVDVLIVCCLIYIVMVKIIFRGIPMPSQNSVKIL
jgi:hypothetical protein